VERRKRDMLIECVESGRQEEEGKKARNRRRILTDRFEVCTLFPVTFYDTHILHCISHSIR
jgi:hypothetical protein